MGKLIVQITEVVYKFIALNILWLFFFVAGLGLFGFMPATLALFRVIRDWIKGNQFNLFSSYFTYYKAEFIRSNIVGAIFIGLFYIIYVNFSFAGYFYSESTQLFVYLVIAAIAAIVLMTFLNVFSVMAHFEYKTFSYIKASLGLVFAHPLMTLTQLVWLLAYFLIVVNFPRVSFVIGISVFAYVLMNVNYSVFKKYNAV
ncbi:hypothetical protein BpOF4_17995 [Alkalihalophilus pseudofirmus OF4]|uniref:Integral membrane protein n=1 Tax=Alkalihalophilus pseudofirmus (strain ATCC BAA-2126 / JCM 17055 / OF4) TaxID=398511 RepID=D3FS05_ALKPO|nr:MULTISPECIES: DUF624 domain-containing protein [Alkalihalophilus]ADC51640.1 hypothetical protein BpOF4_17995 [Alkalihalophilus pseudofirmus OF4]MED1600446.1 DUF624 domain-containing protein [Alkalihalophilus marmarensis]